MKSYKYLIIIVLSLLSLSTFAQTNKKTLNYQAVILDPKAIDIPGASIVGQPLNNGKVCLRFSLLNAQGGLDYEETQQVTTDEYGLVSVNIGIGTQGSSNSIYKSFESVAWNSSVKSLKVSVSYDGCNSFKQVSSQALNYTPYALYAESVDYKNVRDAPTKLSQFANDAGYLIPKDLDPIKADIKSNSSQLATANQTIADNKKSSDAAFLVVNQSITSLDTKVADNTTAIKANTSLITTINTKLTDQQNQINDNRNQISTTNNNLNTQIGGLQGQLNTTNSNVSNLSGTAEVVSNKSTSVNLGGANPSDQLYPSQKATKAYVDQSISLVATSGVPDATTLAAGKIQLAGDLGGTATNPTVPALANKENTANKSLNVLADGSDNTKYPSVKAVKDYVDQATYGTALAADLANKANIASPAFTGVPTAPTPASTDNSTKLATTAFVQAATAGIALQAAVDAKADKNSPTFTGTPSLPTGTVAVTQSSTDNSTKIATTAFVQQATAAGVIDASTSSKGKLRLTGDLGGTADSPTVPGLSLKEDLSNKSNAALGTSTTLYPTQNAVKTYVDAQVASATIVDADATIKGKLQLGGDLAGTNSSASAPVITDDAITSGKIANLAVTDAKIVGVSGIKVSGNITGNAANVTGTVAVGNGGTGATSLTGYVKGNGTSAMTTVSSIPVSDVTGAIKKVNGTLPNANGEVTIAFGEVTTGTLVNRPTLSGKNGDIYIVSADGNTSNNGRTYISDGTNWNEVTTNAAATDARYLQLAGGIMEGNLSVPTGKKVVLIDDPSGSTDAANKGYVDTKVAAGAPDATTVVKGKIALGGDLAGTNSSASTPVISDNAITSGKIANLAVTDAKIVGVSGSKVTGTVGVANGGTGASTLTANNVLLGNGTSALQVVAPGASGNVLTSNGTTWSSSAPQNLANTISGQVQVANGGTGMASLALNGAIYASSATTMTSGTLPLTHGGTGATSASTALTALGAAPLASPTFTGTVTSPIYASAPIALTDAATISWNPANGLNASVTLGGNRTLSFSSTPASGSYGTLVITQDGTGGRTLTLPSGTNRVLGSTSTTTVALSSAANAKDILNFYFDGTTYFWNIGQGYGTAATITANNIAGGAAGSLPYQTGAGATGFLARGIDGQVLTLASGVPSWTAASATGVTSVTMTTPTGLSVSGSPITSSGTLALTLTSGYAIPTTTSQTNWDAAYTNRITSATSPLSISSNALSLGTVPVANGGTGLTSTPANGQIDIGNGTGFTRATLSPGTGVSITNSAGSITINAAARSWADQPTVSANQTSFTLTYAPTANSKIWMFINGVRTNNNAYSFTGSTVTYVPLNNGGYAILASDRVQFDYTY